MGMNNPLLLPLTDAFFPSGNRRRMPITSPDASDIGNV
jgi:hypothetical protein